jgi:FG-GAP repeat
MLKRRLGGTVLVWLAAMGCLSAETGKVSASASTTTDRDSDFNGDGFSDIAIGAVGDAVAGRPEAGSVTIVYGGREGLSPGGSQLLSQASPGVAGDPEPSDAFGWSVASGDFDADGFDDLAVGVPNEEIDGTSFVGAVHVFYGSWGGLGAARSQLWNPGSPEYRGERLSVMISDSPWQPATSDAGRRTIWLSELLHAESPVGTRQEPRLCSMARPRV